MRHGPHHGAQKSTTTGSSVLLVTAVEIGVAQLDRVAVEQGLAAAAADRVFGQARVGHCVGGGAVRAGERASGATPSSR
jgi:hypothetical protein